MKKLIFTLLVFCFAQSLFAQADKLFIIDSSLPKFQQQLLFQNRIIGKTEKGTVYALPQDNMPVFVPDSSIALNIPNKLKGNKPGSTMPNPYYPNKPYLNRTHPTIDSILKANLPKTDQYKQKPAIKQ